MGAKTRGKGPYRGGEGGRVSLESPCAVVIFETRNYLSVCVENFKLEVIQFGAFDAATRFHKICTVLVSLLK